MKNFLKAVVIVFFALIVIGVGYVLTHETVPAGYTGYIYDRTATSEDNVIEGTSVLNVAHTNRVTINPFTQTLITYPSTVVSRNWTSLAEGDNDADMSMQIASKEGKNIDADVYISVWPTDIAKIIRTFGTKSFDNIVDNDIYGLVKGKLSSVSQDYSIYDIQASRTEIQTEAAAILSEVLENTYGVKLERLEFGTLVLPTDIQAKIDQKTQAQNEVEMAKLERQKQDEINQQIVDQQKAQSEKELLERQAKADAAAYEKTAAAEAELAAAQLELEQARLEKEAELERQKAYTPEYFRDKELDNELAAAKAINPKVETIITSGNGEGFGALLGLDRILNAMGN